MKQDLDIWILYQNTTNKDKTILEFNNTMGDSIA